ncbi:echinoderm microtubule-associated protein-like 4, partial [Lates japonicus]
MVGIYLARTLISDIEKGKRALPEEAESETRSSVGPLCLRLRGFSRLLSASDPPGSGFFFQPAGKRRIFSLADGRTRRAARRGQTRLGSDPSPPPGAVEKPGRRPAVCAQPPAGLRPGLPLFSRKMDGFTGSLDDSMSGASVSDVNDRLSALELRVQQQEDELTVMKAALADVLRRLAASEDSAASATKKQQGGKGGTALREAYSMSCIANGGTSGRKRDSTSVTRKETVSSAAKSGADRKKEVSSQRSQMEEIQEREEPPHPKDLSPSPSSPHPPQTPPTPQPQRPAQSADSSKGHAPPKRGPSVKRYSGMERSQSSTWESSEENRNKLVKAASTSKLLAKVVKNAERHKDPVVSQDCSGDLSPVCNSSSGPPYKVPRQMPKFYEGVGTELPQKEPEAGVGVLPPPLALHSQH